MIIQILRDWYPEEYDMLYFLAQKDYETFEQFAKDNERYTKHLIGYGLVQYSKNGYSFNIEAVRKFLTSAHKYEKLNLTDEEKVSEISNRRNRIEKRIRLLIRNTLVTNYGKKKAGERVIAALPQPRRDKFQSVGIEDLLDRDGSKLYFSDITNLIIREWDAFKNVFDLDKERLRIILNDINRFGRPDAHAKSVKKDDFTQLRLHFKKIEAILDEWNII